MAQPDPTPGGASYGLRRRSRASHLWASVLLVGVPLLACLLPLALHGFPGRPPCLDDGLPEGLLDALARDGLVCGVVAGVVLFVAGSFWWETFDAPLPGGEDRTGLVLSTLGVVVVVGFAVLSSLVGGGMLWPAALVLVAAVAVARADRTTPRAVALLCLAGSIITAVVVTQTWGEVLAC